MYYQQNIFQVVLEEAGVERYVHLRSVDDEYEHLESTLPSRARSGGGTGGVGGNPQAEGVEGDPGASENRGDADTVIEGADGDGGDVGDGGPTRKAEPQGRVRDGGHEGSNGSQASSQDGAPKSIASIRHEQQQQQPPECTGGVRNQCEFSPATFLPPEHTKGSLYRDGGAPHARLGAERPDDSAGGSRVESCPGEKERSTAPGRAGDKRHISPSAPPSPYHFRSPSCSPRLSPRPARSPYRQEGVGGRESSSRGESKRGCQEGGRREGPEHSVNSTSGPSDKDGPRGHVADGRGADATAGVRQSGGQAQAGREGEEHGKEATENFDRPDVWPDHQLFSHQTTTGSHSTESQRPPWVDAPEGSFAGSASGVGHSRDEKDSVGFDGSGDGYEGSVVFIDKHDHQSGGEGGQGEDLAGGEESWWHPEGGSVLRGVNFSFESQKEPVVDGEEVICF